MAIGYGSSLPAMGAPLAAIARNASSRRPDLWQQAESMIGQTVQDPYQGAMSNWWSTVMSPGYSAYSPAQIEQMYQQGAEKLRADVFQGWEDVYGQSMANRNLARSGVGGLEMGKILGKEGGALSDLYSNIWQYAQDATRADRSQMASMYPALAATALQYGSQGWDRIMELLGLKVGKEQAESQKEAANASGLGNLIGGLLGLLF